MRIVSAARVSAGGGGGGVSRTKVVTAVPTAKDINEAHQLAKSCAEEAVEHALNCGRMLQIKKKEAGHGNFEEWVDENCDFAIRQAQRYMQAASKSVSRDAFESIRQALGYDKKPANKKPEPDVPKGAVPVVKATVEGPNATGETSDNWPAAPISPTPAVLSERWEPDDDEDAQLELAVRDYEERVDAAMKADDKLAAALAQIKQQSILLATLTLSRDGYQNGKNEVVRLLKKEQAKTKRLREQLKAAEHEIDTLRERAAIQSEAA